MNPYDWLVFIEFIQLAAFALIPVMSVAMTIILWSRPHHNVVFGRTVPTLCRAVVDGDRE